jgi:peptide/nickel transport system permease protein
MATKTSRLSRFYSLEFILGASLTLIICFAVLLSDVLFPGGPKRST